MRRTSKKIVPYIGQMQQTECGICCLAMILAYHKAYVPISDLRDKMGDGRDGTTLLSIKKMAKVYGLEGKGKKVPLGLLSYVKMPSIIFWENRHYVVLEKIKENSFIIVDPASGRRKVDYEEFKEKYSCVVLELEKGVDFQQRNSKQLKLEYFKFLLNSKKLLLAIFFMAIVLQLIAIGGPLLIKYIVDIVMLNDSNSILKIIGIGIIALSVTQAIFYYLHGYLLILLQNKVDLDLMNKFTNHLFLLPFHFFGLRSTGDLIMRASSNIQIREIISQRIISSVLNILLVLGLFVFMVYQSWPLAFLCVGLGIIQVSAIFLTRAKLKLLNQDEILKKTKSNSFLTESLQGISVIKSMGIENESYTHWAGLFSKQVHATKKKFKLELITNTVINMVTFVTPLIIIWFGIQQVSNGTITVGTLFSVQSLAISFLAPLSSLANAASDLIMVDALLDRIFDVINTKKEENEDTKKIANFQGEIELKNVSFRYNDYSPAILKNISLKIAPGEKVAIIGKSGSGKSTLATLLVGLYEPTMGEILFDNISIKELNKSFFRQHIGVVMQDNFLFNKSIKDNILLYKENIDLYKMINVAKIAEIHDDIVKMPMKYETIISETGSNISGGQRQRIVIARALINEPKILLLDEATSALDTVTERKIDENIQSLNCTTIVIAHRLSTIINSDRILIMDNGRIVEEGNHETLIQESPIYQSFYNSKIEQGELTEFSI